MNTFKIALYALTLAAAFAFGFWEMRLKKQLTDPIVPFPQKKLDAEAGAFDFRERLSREKFLQALPSERKRHYRLVVGLKFLTILTLVVEVCFLQR